MGLLSKVSSLQGSDLDGGGAQDKSVGGGRGMTRRSLSQERVIVGAEITQKPSYPSGERTEDSFSLTQYSWLYFQFVDLGKLRASAGLSDLERRGSKPALSSLLEGLLISRKGKKQKRNSW